MKTKQITTLIAMTLGMLALFLLPVMSWQGLDEAEAKGLSQDVGITSVATATLRMVPTSTTITVGNNGITYIEMNNPASGPTNTVTASGSIQWVDVSINFDSNILELSANDVSLIRANSTFRNPPQVNGNTLSFGVDFGANPILESTAFTTTFSRIAQINWHGIADGAVNVTFNSATAADLGGPGAGNPDTIDAARLTGTTITVVYPQSRILNKLTTGDNQNAELFIGDMLETEVRVEDVAEMGGLRFELSYDPTVVSTSEADIRVVGLFNGASPIIRVGNGKIKFYGELSNAVTASSGSVIIVKWTGVGEGTSGLRFDPVGTRLLDASYNDITSPIIDRVDDVSIDNAVGSRNQIPITVNGLPSELYLEKADLNVSAGNTVEQDVRIAGFSNVCEVRFRVKFDSGSVEVVDVDNFRPGVNIGIGSLFGSSIRVDENVAVNETGTIDFRIESATPINVPNSSGQVAKITWKGLAGSTDLTFVQHTIEDCNGSNISHSIQADSNPGSITVSGTSVVNGGISGTVKDSSGAGISGVSVSNGTTSVNTGSNGSYSFSNLSANSYTVTPSLSCYTFSPTDKSVTVASSDVTGVDFTGTKDTKCNVIKHSIKGQVTDKDGKALEGVTVAASPGSKTATTGADGNYEIKDLAAGSYTVTASKTDYSFTSQNVTIAGGDKTGVNFKASDTPPPGDITGLIEVQGRGSASGVDYSGAKIVVSGKTCSTFTVTEARSASADATTDKDGRFSIKTTETIRCLRVIREGHLTGELSQSNISGDVGSLLLLGGDFNDDDKIDIFDLTAIASRYGKDPVDKKIYDFNGDNKGDILDISIVAGNYNKKGPLTNW